MLHIDVVCVGKIKENYLKEAIAEYSKRLSKYCKLNIIEVSDEPIYDNSSDKLNENVKKAEGNRILSHLRNSYIIALDLQGKQYSSEEFSSKIENLSIKHSNISFIIGGSLGLSDEVIQNSNELICFSKMTFPHQLIRVFLLEQLFRGFKIANNEVYHK